ncbi:MAG: TetR/AcrR family transcriptional regulator [Defluviitaleaceae bacterium]|nr:TetR/AcrR family transcriptional regulator [Defluviitaleaceae bacterium]
MPRNKNPEETVKKILEVSLQLFLEKGYDQTTVLDIVNNLGGLTRGAFYHHFKSKEDVLEAIFSEDYFNSHPIKRAQDAKVESGLERLKLALKYGMGANFEHSEVGDTTRLALQLMQKPRFLAEQLKGNREVAALLVPMMEEGMADGSIKPGNAKILTELMLLLLNFWLIPDIFPCDMEETLVKAEMIEKICKELLGFELFDEEIEALFMKAAEMFGWPSYE